MDVCVQSHEGNVVRLAAKGKMVADDPSADARPIHELLERLDYRVTTLMDLQGTDFIGTSGISWLLVLHKRLRQAGGRLAIHSVPVLVMEVLKVMSLDRVFSIAEDEDAALALVQGGEE